MSACGECGADCPAQAKFCAACGAIQRRGRPTVQDDARSRAGAQGAEGPACGTCGEALGEEPVRFCRSCGQAQQQRRGGLDLGEGTTAGKGRTPGLCHGCGGPLEAAKKFCARCGTASRLARVSPSELVAQDPGWYRVVKGLSLVWEGHVTLIVAAISATAVVTVLSLFGASWERMGLVRAALLGATSLAAAVGLVLALVGELYCLAAPSESRTRISTLVTIGLSGAAALLAIIALAWMGSVGFDPSRIPAGAARLSAASLLIFLARLISVSTLLRQIAFALRHYRIAQGSVGFIIFIGVGLAVVGLINLLFQSASESAQTFAQLLALAFALLVAVWYLNMVRRGRDLVRQRLP